MNKTFLAAVATFAAAIAAAPALAASDRIVLERPIPAPRVAVAATANVDRAEVISATPVLRQVAVPQRTCYDQPVVVQRQPSGAGALIGAVAGAAVGNSVGHGAGRAAATALGLVGGAALGNEVETGGAETNGVATRMERRCTTQNAYEDRTVGYDVVYEYNGRQFTTRMRNDPGEFVQVQVQATGEALPKQAPLRGRAGQPVPLVRQGGDLAPAAPAYIEPVYESYVVAPAPYYYGSYYAPAPYYAPSYVPFGAGLAIGALIGFGGHSHGHYGGWRGGWRGGRH